ncbi:MAG: glycosyltransferase family 9 protein, partial [Thermodesulfobacteriota bacterium]|nr:glycosyltransferase family 9 protein [Thermodesulfobacteriota bacterium]
RNFYNGFARSMNVAAPAHTRRYLVAQLARFGDLLQTKRLILSLLENGSSDVQNEVHLVVDRSLSDLTKLIYPDVIVHGITAHGKATQDPAGLIQENMSAFAELREPAYDRVYNLNFSGLNFSLSTLFDPDIVLGYRMNAGQCLKGLWPELAMRWSRYRQFTGLNLMDFWGAFAPASIAPGEVNPIARSKGGGIGVVLGGRHLRRSLPVEVLSPIVGAVFQGIGAKRVTLLGTKAEQPMAKEIKATFPKKVLDLTHDLTGKTNFPELIEAVGGLDVLLTPDTGTMHLAAHLGTPVMAFFLSSAWCYETGPYGLGHRVWQAHPECAPCLETQPCENDLACLEPFSHRDLLRYLSGNAEFEYPPGLLGLVSVLDPLGVTYRPVMGQDPWAERRLKFRSLVAEHQGMGMSGPLDSDFAAQFFQERDWMLKNESSPDKTLECM